MHARIHRRRFIPCRMFANYLPAALSLNALIKFEFVEETRHPDIALYGEILEDIKKRTTGLIAERNRLVAENARLEDRVKALEVQLASCEEQRESTASTHTPTPAHSPNPAVGERIRALVEEIDACMALMPRSREMVTADIMTA